MARSKDSPETRRLKREAALAAAAERRSRKRWYITLSLKPPPMHVDRYGYDRYSKVVWPKLFSSEEEAWAHAHACQSIWSPPPGVRRVVSYALSTTYLPKRA